MASYGLFEGTPGVTFSHASTDSSHGFESAEYTKDGDEAIGAFIVCETQAVRVAFGTAPTQAGLGIKLSVGDTLELKSRAAVKAFRFISAAAGVHGTLQVTMEY